MREIAVLVGQAQFDRDRTSLAVAGRVHVLEEGLFVHVERCVHLRHRHQRRQRHRRGAGGDHVAHGDFGARHAAGHRRFNARVAQVQLGVVQGGLRALQVGGGFARGVLLFLEVAAGDGVVRQQALAAGQFRGGVRRAGLGGRQGGGGAVHFGRVRARVDGEEHVALLDDAAVLEVHGRQGAGHQRADVDAVDGFQAAGIALPVHDGLADDFSHLDGRGGGGALGHGDIAAGRSPGQGIAASGREYGCKDDEHSDTIARNHDVSLSGIGAKARLFEPGAEAAPAVRGMAVL